MPLVSVVIPCFNRASTISQAIAAVKQQTLPDWELLIVDDGSSDDLADALAPLLAGDPRIRLIHHDRNRGAAAARNTGVSEASGRFVAFLDSDDDWLPQKLEQQIKAILAAADPEATLCVTQTIVRLPGGRRIIRPTALPSAGRSFGEYLFSDGGFAQCSSFLLAKSLAARIPFSETLRQAEDYLFFMRLGAAQVHYLLVPEALTVWDNLERPGRISTGDTLAKWREIIARFRGEAATIAPERVLLAAEARLLTAHLWKASPSASVGLLWRAYRAGALSGVQTLRLLGRNALPRQAYDGMRHVLAVAGSARRGGRDRVTGQSLGRHVTPEPASGGSGRMQNFRPNPK